MSCILRWDENNFSLAELWPTNTLLSPGLSDLLTNVWTWLYNIVCQYEKATIPHTITLWRSPNLPLIDRWCIPLYDQFLLWDFILGVARSRLVSICGL